VKAKRRKGRGVGSSKGKTCGRGHKGQKAKENIHPLFEGGQTPLYKLLPKRGFGNARHKKDMVPLGLSTLQNYVDMGRIDPSRTVTLHDLLDAGIFKANAVKHGVKLLAFKGEASTVKQPLNILVSRASSQAIAAVESAGGTVTTVHYNRLALRQLLRPHKFLPLPSEDNEGGRGDGDGSRDGRRRRVRQARPPPKFQPYYTSYKNRGYLNPVVQMRNWFQNAEASGNTTSDVDFQQLREAFERSIKGLY
jgi:large subunit ribosomal protein L15